VIDVHDYKKNEAKEMLDLGYEGVKLFAQVCEYLANMCTGSTFGNDLDDNYVEKQPDGFRLTRKGGGSSSVRTITTSGEPVESVDIGGVLDLIKINGKGLPKAFDYSVKAILEIKKNSTTNKSKVGEGTVLKSSSSTEVTESASNTQQVVMKKVSEPYVVDTIDKQYAPLNESLNFGNSDRTFFNGELGAYRLVYSNDSISNTIINE
jgi:hypothetical protein